MNIYIHILGTNIIIQFCDTRIHTQPGLNQADITTEHINPLNFIQSTKGPPNRDTT